MRHCVITMVVLACSAIARAGELRIGAAALKITPPVGVPLAGYYSERASEGVHDELYARAIVIERDGTKAALVSLDVITTLRTVVQEARLLAEKQCGIPAGNIMISATHAHTGPIFATGSRRFDALGGTHPLAVEYTKKLPALIAQAVVQACGAMVDGRALSTSGIEENLAFNRRFHMTDGTVGWNPGKLNPRIIRPVGPTDPRVPVVFFETLDKTPKPLATYVNFAMHLDTVGGMQISADYPHVLARMLAETQGPEMLTMFTIGCAGDLNHINVQSARPQKGQVEAARIGTILAGNVLRSYERLEPAGQGLIQSASAMVRLSSPQLTPQEIESAKGVLAQIDQGSKPPPKFMDQVQAFKVSDVIGRKGEPWEVEVQVVTLGPDIAWVALPGEIFVELGLAIKNGSPFRHTIIAELANGSIGYIPTARAYTEGNYEVVSARCAQGSGEMLVDAAVKLLRESYAKARPADRIPTPYNAERR